MPNPYFQFRQFTVYQRACSMKVTTDSCLFGAWVADTLEKGPSVKNILDIGSGTGLLSLMIAQKCPAFIEGIELQKADHLESVQNLAASPWSGRMRVHLADALSFPYSKKYDVIVSNPPFYENDLLSQKTAKNVAHHHQGLRLADLIRTVQNNLHPLGRFFLLVPERRGTEAIDLLTGFGFFINQRVWVRQTEKHGSFRQMIGASFAKTNENQSVIVIKKDGGYSETFKTLLQDYYL